MIPLKLQISGFLSYQEPVDLDFTGFDLACISGANGAGKSSLLDAITWVIFGQARKRDDSLINTFCDSAEVVLIFAYEGNVYRVQRANPRGKTSLLEYHILQRNAAAVSPDELPPPEENNGVWKALTERTLRATQASIEATLRMDYETFVNAAFFLQGKADQFTQQRPSDRKRILSSILGLEIWETYRQRAAERRKAVEQDIAALDGRLAEIEAELAESKARRAALKQLEAELERLKSARQAQETALGNIRQLTAALNEQRKLVTSLARQVEATNRQIAALEQRRASRQTELDEHAERLAHSEEIEAAYQRWLQARQDVEYWDEIARRFHEQEKRRQAPLTAINTTQARLAQEEQTLRSTLQEIQVAQAEQEKLLAQLEAARNAIAQAEAKVAERREVEAGLQALNQRLAEARAENPRLRAEMDELRERIDRLSVTEGATCPLCGQPLSADDRQRLIGELQVQGTELGDRFRTNKAALEQAGQDVKESQERIRRLASADASLRSASQTAATHQVRLEEIEKGQARWEAEGAPRLAEVSAALAQESFAPEARTELAEIDAELLKIGYDASAHDAARQAEASGRAAETELRQLENARAAVAPLERELTDLQDQVTQLRETLGGQQAEHDQAAAQLAAAEAQAPDLQGAERELLKLQEAENRGRMEVGAAQQRVAVLADLKTRRQELQERREALSQVTGRYRQLERAFGKDGVPALLIEQALPQIESKANEILDRLSGGNMSVRFVTQASYKDKRRDDLRETLDIQISDNAGVRDYEMFSGGEAFRVNFAIRLALSEVLAQRAGARLQTLVIDEGFGSQDALGRQRLIETINLVRPDFAKILVITHIDELKDAFPTRIEVEKTSQGSRVRVT